MNMEFNYFIPTRILFGTGKLKELAKTRLLPGKKALIVISSGGSMKRQGYLGRVTEYLSEAGAQSVVFTNRARCRGRSTCQTRGL
jgi:alcohol dehydrogenase